MALKYTKIPKILLICTIIAMMIIPAVSAKNISAIHSGTIVNKQDTKNYIINPAKECSTSSINSISSALSIQYISQWQSIIHAASIGSTAKFLEVYLNWGNSGNSLSLTIYTPSGTNIGTCYDSFDGKKDGIIWLYITPSQGYMQQGTWRFKVTGESVSGTEDYSFNLYQHC